MNALRHMTAAILFVLITLAALLPAGATAQVTMTEAAQCEALQDLRNLTILGAGIRSNPADGSDYCYVRGIIPPAIHFHVQLPLQQDWNGRFLQWGDGGKDGDLDFAPERVAEGYAVANSNLGHDNGVEPGASFGFNNRQAEIDFGYRAVHLTAAAGKRLVAEYYSQSPRYSYFEGCSQGGRQGFMSAQRFPGDFDGIVAGAPAFNYQGLNAAGTWGLQRMFRDDLAGNLAVDSDGDGSFDSLALMDVLHEQVLNQCDALDGVRDGLVSDPLSCNFDPQTDLGDLMCPAGDASDGSCFTPAQVQTITDFYDGPRDDAGRQVYPGKMFGSEPRWAGYYIPWEGNDMGPSKLMGVAGDHMNYLFYDQDPGIAVPDVRDIHYEPDTDAVIPEFHWFHWDINDFHSGAGDVMKSITDANDPDLHRFVERGGKMIVYHGLVDTLIVATDTINYYNDMVNTTFAGSMAAAQEHARLYLAPGMGHCRGGPGPDTWDKLAPLVDWVENGRAPDSIVATHETGGRVDNERPLCTYPQQARYVGPAGGADDPANWVAENFQCR